MKIRNRFTNIVILIEDDLTNLTGADLRDADLRDANLRDAHLRCADLRDADLRDANLRDADLRYADLTDADLTDADLTGAHLTGAHLEVVFIGNIGSRSSTTYYKYKIDQLNCGCFTGSLDEFIKKVNSSYEQKTVYYKQYHSAINFFKQFKTKQQ